MVAVPELLVPPVIRPAPAAGSILALSLNPPAGCGRVWIEVESQDCCITWLANPWNESALRGRRNLAPTDVLDYRWSADTSPAGGKACFALVQPPPTVTVIAFCQISGPLASMVDQYNGTLINGILPAPRVAMRAWSEDPLAWAEWQPKPIIYGGPSGPANLGQTAAGATTQYGFPPGYCRWFTGYANNGCQWQVQDASGAAFLVANQANQRLSAPCPPFCVVSLFNGGGAATQGVLGWSIRELAT